jgi:hypothetical protein
MENLFRPGKWLVLFCGLFVLLWAVLQYVSNQRLKLVAQEAANDVFTWNWPGDWRSSGEITEASVLKKDDHDAVVKVKGHQVLTFLTPGVKPDPTSQKTETVDCSATLSFYRKSVNNKDYWVLGKVEFP